MVRYSTREICLMFVCASISCLINTYPIKAILSNLNINAPALGMAIFGGFVFVFWISLAYKIVNKPYSGVFTSLLVVSLCLLISPWYGVVKPEWFGIYGIIAFFAMGVLIEKLNGGFGNLACLLITWFALIIHANVKIPLNIGILLAIISFISGFAGDKCASFMVKYILNH